MLRISLLVVMMCGVAARTWGQVTVDAKAKTVTIECQNEDGCPTNHYSAAAIPPPPAP